VSLSAAEINALSDQAFDLLALLPESADRRLGLLHFAAAAASTGREELAERWLRAAAHPTFGREGASC
jgi:hypothetical protein